MSNVSRHGIEHLDSSVAECVTHVPDCSVTLVPGPYHAGSNPALHPTAAVERAR